MITQNKESLFVGFDVTIPRREVSQPQRIKLIVTQNVMASLFVTVSALTITPDTIATPKVATTPDVEQATGRWLFGTEFLYE